MRRVKRAAEVLIEDALNNVYLESSLKPSRKKKRAVLEKVPIAPTTPNNHRSPSRSHPNTPFAQNVWQDEPEIDHPIIEKLPVRSKVNATTFTTISVTHCCE